LGVSGFFSRWKYIPLDDDDDDDDDDDGGDDKRRIMMFVMPTGSD